MTLWNVIFNLTAAEAPSRICEIFKTIVKSLFLFKTLFSFKDIFYPHLPGMHFKFESLHLLNLLIPLITIPFIKSIDSINNNPTVSSFSIVIRLTRF